MLAISEFRADDSFPSPELDRFQDINPPDFASWNPEAATINLIFSIYNNKKAMK